jgi:AraC family transcriptional regulator of adaptative response/methylated-DNA-[protein]-cysteine methyltransferase
LDRNFRIAAGPGGCGIVFSTEEDPMTVAPTRTPSLPPQEILWQALRGRDASFDGAFVVGVTSTGIYCRPSCPSRQPRRANVRFFATPIEAETHGLRACRRCRPDQQAAPNPARDKVLAACRALEGDHERIPTLKELGALVEMSPSHLQRVFKRLVGVSPWQYGDALRLERFKGELRAGEDVAGAGYGSGYGSSSRLYEQAPARLGMTPGRYARRGAGEVIRYGSAPCSLGKLLIAATERGVCSVRLGESERDLVAGLEAEFVAATVEPGGRALDEWLAALVAFVDREQELPELPCDVQATAFQRQVWEAIRAIPLGETATYSEVAAAIGRPRAVRAVASACAANPIALLVPCHRVVPKSAAKSGPRPRRAEAKPAGRLADAGEYRWGRERKAALLERERQAAGAVED